MSIERSKAILPIVQSIHTATGRDELWAEVLSRLRHLFQARFASVAKHQFSSGQGQGLYASPVNSGINTEYTEKFSMRNPWFLSSQHYEEGNVLTGEDILSNEDLKETDFYQQFLRPNKLYHQLCGAIARTQNSIYYIAFLRGEDQTKFNNQYRKLLAIILTHLTIAFRNHWRLLQNDDLANILQSTINRFACATFVVDRCGSVLYRNQRSDEFIRENGSLGLTNSHINALSTTENRSLLQAIDEVANLADTQSSESEKVVTLSSPDHDRPVMVNIHPLGHIYCVEKAETVPVVGLTVRDPNKTHHPKSCSFSNLYELTPAQSRLSSLVFSGYSLIDAAEHLNVSENTIRSHLKQIYQKTHTHGQMELVHLHAKICTDHI